MVSEAPTTTVPQPVRFIVVLDKQANATTPALNTILSPGTFYGVRNLDYRKRFKIMLDKVTNLSVPGADMPIKNYHIYMKFRRPIVVDYNGGGAGSIGDISTNAMWLVAIGTIASAPNLAVMSGTARIRYVDM